MHRAIDDRAAEFLGVDLAVVEVEALLGQIADEAAGEAIARAGRIENLFEQIAGNHEVELAGGTGWRRIRRA